VNFPYTIVIHTINIHWITVRRDHPIIMRLPKEIQFSLRYVDVTVGKLVKPELLLQ
jgi:hypothetical protein